ncbi:MBL fold metallo-hydrolase [Actinomyces sp. 2119]|uniref:MBL fold metallo-hydrolase n=1 Tax=Actinomyces sp. 2119 TaxID=2321393 RepID=UPI000E6BB6AC|nr:MBL fold metallo-hydrolase [Actinomyces sp. 2119]RJF44716.1 MBL fold metallo-hydrolase [Actinomyces sp. 2119]
MIIERTVAPVFAANCYVLAPAPGAPALVVDPGAGAAAGALALLRAHRLTLGAVLLTHGHADHVWDTSALVATAHAQGLLARDDAVDVPAYLPQPDLYRMEDPDATTGIRSRAAGFADMAGTPWVRPTDLRAFPEEGYSRAVEPVPGIAVQAVPAPGHTEGSAMFFLNAALGDHPLLHEAEVPEVVNADPAQADQLRGYLVALGGDVIFKGSVGRTDLPGGDQYQMLATLRLLATAVSPGTLILPGHGAATTMAHELRANPYLAEARVRGGETGR